jgi:hypothetical protein
MAEVTQLKQEGQLRKLYMTIYVQVQETLRMEPHRAQVSILDYSVY